MHSLWLSGAGALSWADLSTSCSTVSVLLHTSTPCSLDLWNLSFWHKRWLGCLLFALNREMKQANSYFVVAEPLKEILRGLVSANFAEKKNSREIKRWKGNYLSSNRKEKWAKNDSGLSEIFSGSAPYSFWESFLLDEIFLNDGMRCFSTMLKTIKSSVFSSLSNF